MDSTKAKRTAQMKDTVAKMYLQDLELVADLFNVFVFGGKRRLSPNTLKPFPTEDNGVTQGIDGTTITDNMRRDMSFLAYTDDRAMFYLCIEVQSGTDWTMPLRVMRYDAAKYQHQLDMRGGKRGQGLLPVFTLVLNLGKGRWKGPRSLHEMMTTTDERTRNAVSDYRINIVDPYDIDANSLDMLCTEIKDVLTYFRASRDSMGFDEFLKKNSDVCLSEKAILLLNTYLHTKLKPQTNGRKTRMCIAWKSLEERTLAKGMRRGLKKGRLEGREEGRLEGREETLKNHVLSALKINLDFNTIQKITGMPLADIEKIASTLNANA